MNSVTYEYKIIMSLIAIKQQSKIILNHLIPKFMRKLNLQEFFYHRKFYSKAILQAISKHFLLFFIQIYAISLSIFLFYENKLTQEYFIDLCENANNLRPNPSHKLLKRLLQIIIRVNFKSTFFKSLSCQGVETRVKIKKNNLWN